MTAKLRPFRLILAAASLAVVVVVAAAAAAAAAAAVEPQPAPAAPRHPFTARAGFNAQATADAAARPRSNSRLIYVPDLAVPHRHTVARAATPSAGRRRRHEHCVVLFHDIGTYANVDWLGDGSDVVLALFMDTLLPGTGFASRYWRSDDYGHTFTNMASALPADAVVYDWHFDNFFTSRFHLTDAKKNVTYVTIDGGASYTARNTPFYPSAFLFHPSDPNTLMAINSRVSNVNLAFGDLWISTNNGGSWTMILKQVEQFAFGDVTYGDAEGTIYAQTRDGQLSVSNDLGATFQTLMTGLSYFQLDGEYMFAITDAQDLYVSLNRSTLTKATFPVAGTAEGVFVLDSFEQQVFVAHASYFGDTNRRDLYISGRQGLSYVASLEDIVYLPSKNSRGVIDFTPVNSMRGVYIANHLVTFGTDTLVRSVITYDKGGNWHAITPPAEDVDGDPFSCIAANCSLHLHSDLTAALPFIRATPIYSSASAIGLIVASGVVGADLDYYSDEVPQDVFVSRDAGANWKHVLRGSHMFATADHGGLIVAIERDINTNILSFSYNEGRTWQQFQFFEDKIRIAGLLTEPGETSVVFSVYGYDEYVYEWIAIQVDFSTVLGEPCTESDYEFWGAARSVERHAVHPGSFARLRTSQAGYRKIAGDSCVGGDESLAPVATPCPKSPILGLTLSATVTSAIPVSTTVIFRAAVQEGSLENAQYIWNFGDDTATVGTSFPNVTHIFAAGGLFSVSVTVKNGISESSASMTIEVQDNLAVAGFDFPPTVYVDQKTTFAVRMQPNLYFGASTYLWSFGPENVVINGSSSIVHTFKKKGTYTVALSIHNKVDNHAESFTVEVVQGDDSGSSFPIAAVAVPAVLVVIALGAVVYHYRRKYSELNVRYSSLAAEIAPEDANPDSPSPISAVGMRPAAHFSNQKAHLRLHEDDDTDDVVV
ncbi:hypothetical protein CAOG_010209 [Capsaspora owczarzaki ATCC 30864]|uniref:PKD domain-containing protein n=1 Tax=Capsaspora owczarzaki (strain ATCC 30864) TaxID=595528 RepID=A0A0D2W1V6_CAPO3|nr:hypothetical protein CAOG_010209 [Capsaspora owczarzaki ATCC 30864]